jgi:hypothetical protein
LPYESFDGTLTEDHAIKKWTKLLQEGSEVLGRPFNDPRTYQAALEGLGFVDVHTEMNPWPLNAWPKDKKWKELGAWAGENILNGAAAFSYVLLINGLGWSKDAIDVFLVDVRKGIKDKSVHSYLPT